MQFISLSQTLKMNEWLKLSLLLSVFGFLKEIRPSQPFLFDFLIGEWRNVTIDDVNREVFPVGTYAYMAQLIIVFLITDFLRYRPLIILIGFCGITIWSMLLWTTSLLALQILEVIYGTYVASEVAYYTYIYAKVDRNYYPKVSSHARAAIFGGKFLGSGIGQLMIAYKWMDYRELNFISLSTQIAATLWSFSLPSVKTSIYFHRENSIERLEESNHLEPLEDSIKTKNIKRSKTKDAFALIYVHFKQAYSNSEVVQWSVAYSFGLCGNLLVLYYIQALWNEIDDSGEVIWNGAVEAVMNVACAFVAFSAGHFYSKTFMQKHGLTLLSVLSMVQGGLILLACLTDSRWISYLGYLLFNVVFAFLITISTVEIAKHLVDDSFGLIFGINTFVAVLLQTIITILIISESGFHLSLIDQYITISIFFITLGVSFLIYSCVQLWRAKRTNAKDYVGVIKITYLHSNFFFIE